MKSLPTLFACLGFVILLCGPTAAEEKKDDAKAMNGLWNVEKATFRGTDATDAFKEAKLTITDGKYSVEFSGQTDEGTLKLDATKKPKTMDVLCTEGPNKGKTFPSIYELDGDTLKICYTLEGKDRPAGFESKEGTETLLVTYKRAKK